MKRVANILLILGVMVFIATSALFLYQFDKTGSPSIGEVIGMTGSGAFSLFAIFMRRRIIQGIPVFEMTSKDKAQFKKLGHELNVWRFGSRILAGIGFISLIAGFQSFLNLDSSDRSDWRVGIVCFVFGTILILPAIIVGRRFRGSK